MKNLLFIVCIGIFFIVGCNQTPDITTNLPVLDASSPEKLVGSLKTMSASVPEKQKIKFDSYMDFYIRYQIPAAGIFEDLALQLDGKNYKELLAFFEEDLLKLKTEIERYLANLSIIGIPTLATSNDELNKIIITNINYNKSTNIKEMDIENKTNKTISALQIMTRVSFDPHPHAQMAIFLVDFPPLRSGQKIHVTEKEKMEFMQKMLASRIVEDMPAVAIQAFDKDKNLVINNDEVMKAIDMIAKIQPKVAEIERLLQL